MFLFLRLILSRLSFGSASGTALLSSAALLEQVFALPPTDSEPTISALVIATALLYLLYLTLSELPD